MEAAGSGVWRSSGTKSQAKGSSLRIENQGYKGFCSHCKLFHQVQVIAAKIKATGNLAILKNDYEYVALVSTHLSKEVMWD